MHTLDRYLFSIRYSGEVKPIADGSDLWRGEAYWTAIPNWVASSRRPFALEGPPGRPHGAVRNRPAGAGSQVAPGDPRHAPRLYFRGHSPGGPNHSAEVGQTDHTSGDPIGCSVMLENRTDHPLQGLRLEFSERYWPWIVQQKDRVGSNISTIQSDITLSPHSRWRFDSGNCTEAKEVKQPATETILRRGMGPRAQERRRASPSRPWCLSTLTE